MFKPFFLDHLDGFFGEGDGFGVLVRIPEVYDFLGGLRDEGAAQVGGGFFMRGERAERAGAGEAPALEGGLAAGEGLAEGYVYGELVEYEKDLSS